MISEEESKIIYPDFWDAVRSFECGGQYTIALKDGEVVTGRYIDIIHPFDEEDEYDVVGIALLTDEDSGIDIRATEFDRVIR